MVEQVIPDAGKLVERHLSDRFEWAAPGDQQEDAWIVRFCDNDVRDMLFTGASAEREAWEAWNRHAPGYNMYVFRLACLRDQVSPDVATALRALLEWAEYAASTIEGEWGSSRTLEQLEADGDLEQAILDARAALTKET